ncbi:MAG: sulfur transferase domain-containing protein [Proteobacteria bacterium]|nr:sulfur transferase domain-containing protein [Pseudomonadota bacterium]MDA0929731.1 sulfur transferase domain-containing protein [Pseudomonadota bacterium]
MKAIQMSRLLGTLILSSLLAACASNSGLDVAALEQAEIFNFRAPGGSVVASGQPTADQLGVASRAGVKHVISLRAPGEEVGFDESSIVQSLGMQFHSIPVAGAAGVTPENAASLQQLLDRYSGEPILVHCASSNRVGALMALSAFADGESAEDAMNEGIIWGLSSEGLQQVVRQNLTEN